DARMQRHPEVAYTITRRYEASWTASDSPLAVACLRGVSRGLGHAGHMDGRIGGSDSRLWRRAGFPCVALGLSAYNLGAPDEYCAIEELDQLKSVYTAIL